MAKEVSRRERVRKANEEGRRAVLSAAKGGEHLGDIAWWTLEQGFREQCHTVSSVYNKHGIDPVTTLPLPTDYTVAFGRAVNSVRTAVHSLGWTCIDAARGPNGERRVGIIKVERNGKVATHHEGTITCPNDGTRPYVEIPDPAGITTQIYDKTLDLFGVYTSDDIRTSIVTVLKRYAALLCNDAGTYYVPAGGCEQLTNLNAALQELNAGEISQFSGYLRDAHSVNAVTKVVNQGLEAKMRAFAEDAEAYVQKESSQTTKGQNTLARRIEDAKALREQADLYRMILGAAVASVDERIAKVETVLKEAMT